MKNKTIAIVSSSVEYTQGIFPFVRILEDNGYSVKWISFRSYEYYWLIKNGIANENILNTSAIAQKPNSLESIEFSLRRLENGQTPYVNQIISMDRLLKLKSYQFSRNYLANLEQSISTFLEKNSVNLVSGGRDTALQISTSKICQKIGIHYVVPTVTRVPDNRYGFCEGYTESSFVTLRSVTDLDRKKAIEYIENYRINKPQPFTVEFERTNNRFLKRLPKDLRLFGMMFFRGLFDFGNDYTRYTLKMLLKMYIKRRLNYFLIKISPPFEKCSDRPYVLYAYQMQPESGIDVLAAAYSDQYTLIKQIALSVPSTHDLYVKPHPDHVGGLSRSMLKKIAAIPGVRLINPDANGRQLMHNAAIVITPAGTMACEAAMHRIPSIIFADEFFGMMPNVRRCTSIELLPKLISELINESNTDDAALVEYIANLFTNTFYGRQTNYFGSFTHQELREMRDAFDLVYSTLVKRWDFRKAKNQYESRGFFQQPV